MKASELIIILENIIKDKGDLDLVVSDIEYGDDSCCGCRSIDADVTEVSVSNNKINIY